MLELSMKKIKLAEDVDIKKLALMLNGYSGADITNVCRDAAMMPARKKLKGLTREEMMSMQVEEMDQPVTQADFEEAISKIQPSVTQSDVEKHERWMAEFGSV